MIRIKTNWNKGKVINLSFYFLGLILIYYVIYKGLMINGQIIVKNDFIDQHIPFYIELENLLKNGFPFWSWNLFLGTNFWASKAYYLIGDLYAWLTILFNIFFNNIVSSLSLAFILKLTVTYTLIFIFIKRFKLNIFLTLGFSLYFTLSGWNTTFIEHPFYMSFYSIIPLLLIGIYDYYLTGKYFWLVISVSILVSINFYLFWVISILVLIIWLFLNLMDNKLSNLKQFFKTSFRLLLLYIIGVLIASIVWFPAVLHIIQTNRLGSYLNEYDWWSTLNVASFITFSLIPRLNYFFDGIFKDTWYYFHQISIYIGVLTILIIPHCIYIFHDKRKNRSYFALLILSIILLVSPKIGLFFHFTYSLRYTLIISIIWFLIALDVMKEIEKIDLKAVFIIESVYILFYLLIKFYFLSTIYDNLPPHIEELHLLDISLILSFIYSIILILFKFYKGRKSIVNVAFIFFGLVMCFEVSYFNKFVFQSHIPIQSIKYFSDNDLDRAINDLKIFDKGFYRVYHNFDKSVYLNYENISMISNIKTVVTYDSVYQYPLINFLTWFRQYPNTNWHFRFYEPTFFKILNVKYAIIDTEYIDENVNNFFAYPIEGMKYGKYQIYKYYNNDFIAFSYNKFDKISKLNQITKEDKYEVYQISDKLLSTLYLDDQEYEEVNFSDYSTLTTQLFFEPSNISNNYIEFSFNTDSKNAVFFSIPFDKGWKVYDNDNALKVYNVQGGFIGLFLNEGLHRLVFKYVTPGFKTAILITFFSLILFVVVLIYDRKRKIK